MSAAAAPLLSRETFRTGRLAEFRSTRELTAQTGHPIEDWPLVIGKELADNGIDLAEEIGVAPVIDIKLSTDPREIVVTDNGPGIPAETITNILDYSTRTSSRALYVSPSRGQQGNALQTILAMGLALDGKRGETVIEAHGVAHKITFTVDPIAIAPRITRELAASPVKNGTRITVKLPVSACHLLDTVKRRFLQIAHEYAAVNPHLSLGLEWDGAAPGRIVATNLGWGKWSPSAPVPAHWLTEPTIEPYIAAHIRRDPANGRQGLPHSGRCEFAFATAEGLI